MMTFLQFQATATPCADLTAHPVVGLNFSPSDSPMPGIVYTDDCYLTARADGRFDFPVYNESLTGTREEMERDLYNWIVSEQIDETPLTAENLADAFARSMRATLTADEMAAVVAHPASYPYCLTHDYCDANQVLLDVYAEMTDVDEFDMDTQGDLFNEAWGICRANAWAVSTPAVAESDTWALEPMTSNARKADGSHVTLDAREGVSAWSIAR